MADTPAPKQNTENKETGFKVKLLAKSYLQRVPGTNPVQYRRRKKGDVFTVTEDEFAIGNGFKPGFEKVEG